MSSIRVSAGEPIRTSHINDMQTDIGSCRPMGETQKAGKYNYLPTGCYHPSFGVYLTPLGMQRVTMGYVCYFGTIYTPRGLEHKDPEPCGALFKPEKNIYLYLYINKEEGSLPGEGDFHPPAPGFDCEVSTDPPKPPDEGEWETITIQLTKWHPTTGLIAAHPEQLWASDVFIYWRCNPGSGGGGETSLWSLSMVPGPGIDIENTTETTEDGTTVIIYKISGRLSQYRSHKPNEQGDIVGITVQLNPNYEPQLEAGANIVDGHIQISITPGPMVSLVPGPNIDITTDNTHTANGYPLIVYTISTKGGGGSISITPGPGIRIDDVTTPGNPVTMKIAKNFDIVGVRGIGVSEKTSVSNPNYIRYEINGDELGMSVTPGPVVDPDRPREALTTPEMIANGWTQVSGTSQDPIGHTHALFMAVRNNKIYMSMLYPMQ